MAQIVNRPPSWAEALSTGLGSGIQQLAQMKLEEVAQQKHQQRSAAAYRSLGLPNDWAEALSRLPEKQAQTFLSGWAQTPQTEAMQNQQVAPEVARSINMALGYQPIERPVQMMPQVEKPSADLKELLSPLVRGITQQQQASQIPQIFGGPKPPVLQEVPEIKEKIAAAQQKGATVKNIFAKGLQTPQERIAAKKMEQQERHFEETQKKEAFKASKAERKEIIEKARNARQALHDLDRMEELEKEGKLDTPGYIEFLKRSGLDIPALMEPGSEEFNKIAANFIRGAKETFGARISNFEVEQFLKTLPNLSQSPEGRKRVIANLKYLNRAAVEHNEALKEVMKENKGVPPLDLLEQVDEKIDKRLNKIAEKFKKDLAKPVPKGQDRWKTAAQSIAGSVLGAPGTAVSGLGGLMKTLI